MIEGCVCHEDCATCGYYDDPTDDDDCITCPAGADIEAVYDDGTGYCFPTDVMELFSKLNGDLKSFRRTSGGSRRTTANTSYMFDMGWQGYSAFSKHEGWMLNKNELMNIAGGLDCFVGEDEHSDKFENSKDCFDHWEEITAGTQKFFAVAVEFIEKPTGNTGSNTCNYLAVDVTQEECAAKFPEITEDMLVNSGSGYKEEFEYTTYLLRDQTW